MDTRETNGEKNHRVLHIIVPEPIGEVGGADLHVLDLASAQVQRGAYSPIVLTTQNPEYAERLHLAKVPYVPNHLDSGTYHAKFLHWRDIPRNYNINLIHSHGYDADYITFMLKLAYPKIWGTLPVIMTCHGLMWSSYIHRLKTLLNLACFLTADALIVCNPNLNRQLKRFPQGYPITFLPNGIYPASAIRSDQAGHRLRLRYGITCGMKLVGAVGRLSPEKRMDIFVETARNVAAIRQDVHFLIVGSGPERQAIEAMVDKYDLKHRFTFTGMVHDMTEIYKGLSLLVVPSDTEGTPRVVLEAMAHAVPVIATRVGGVPTLIENGKHGYLVERRNPTELARRTLMLLQDNEQRKAMGDKGRARVSNHYTIWKMREQVEEVYDRVIAMAN